MTRTEKALGAKDPRQAIVDGKHIGLTEGTKHTVTVVVKYRNTTGVATPDGAYHKVPTTDVEFIDPKATPAPTEQPAAPVSPDTQAATPTEPVDHPIQGTTAELPEIPVEAVTQSTIDPVS